MISAILEERLATVEFTKDPVFGFEIPNQVPHVPGEILIPKNTWCDKDAYEEKLKFLAGLFVKNFEKYAAGVSEEVLKESPIVDALPAQK